ncbi:SLC13 family permease [Variovorax sp. J22P240]|uniref:SLC13 family permease n=1 Tax=unclassified Variovorax TaxID=663243 RepID=UPI002575EC0F|nr:MULTISPECIES: SLC13 family permease [unclassified Variovorax]MDM0001729.1 SLC13 family permease [Variovorax sp. J22P240]MDM0047849.1 SLC13 family permease [Variovorax sp. J22R115]
MSSHWISIYALIGMFVLATVLPINMGVIAFVGAFLVGTLVAGMNAKAIMGGFPADLFLTLVGITYLFALAQNNGTIDWLVKLAVRAVRGRIAAIPWIMFFIAALLTAVGAVSPAAVAIIAPIALGFAAKYGINPLLMGLMVVHGAQGGGFSPISIYGGITNKIVARAGLPLNEMATMLASLGVNLAVALLLFFMFGGMKLVRQKADPTGAMPAVPRVAHGQGGAQVYGDAEGESFSEERRTATPDDDSLMDASPATPAEKGSRLYQIATVGGLLALAVLTLFFKQDIGFVSITIGLLLTLMAPNLQKRALGQVSWPEIMLIVGVSTYVGVMEKMGTIDFVGHSVAGLTSPLMAALLLCFVGAVVSAFASSTAVLGSLIPLAVPFLQGEAGVSAIGFIAAMAVSSTIVDVSPFSTNGALVLANAKGVDRDVFFRHLMVYGAIVTVVAPVVVWLLFVVL